MKKTLYFSIGLLLAASLLVGCGTKERVLSTEEQATVLAYADPMTDDLFTALASGSYSDFVKDMEEEMADASTEVSFNSLRDLLSTKAGTYISRSVKSVVDTGEYYAVNYAFVYEKSPEVTVRVVFTKTDPPKVTGLWLNSPELAK